MRRPRFLGIAAPLVAVLALFAAGCGSDDKLSATPQRAVAPASADNSLFTEANLKVALNAINAKLGGSGKVAIFKIEPNSAAATVSKAGKFELLTSDKAGAVQVVSVPAGSTQTFPMSKIDAAVPAKILDQLASKYNKKLDDVDYMVALADPASNKPFWDVFVKGGVEGPYQADIDGSNLATAAERAADQLKHATTTATPPPPGPGQPPPTGTTSTKIPDNILKIQQCITKAGNDPAKAADCVRHAKIQRKP